MPWKKTTRTLDFEKHYRYTITYPLLYQLITADTTISFHTRYSSRKSTTGKLLLTKYKETYKTYKNLYH
jgi:hypothetical protein